MTGTDLPDLEEFRTIARTWLEANLERRPGGATRSTSEDRTPEDIASSRILQRKLYDGGFAGIDYPEELGGAGLTPAHAGVFEQEARGFVLPDFGGAGHVMFTAIGRSLLAHCTADFQQRRIPKLLAGEELWCQFYSEPEAGSDLAGIRTTAVADGDRWVINGSKIWSTGANHADWAMCLTRTDWTVPKHRGLTWFAVPTATPGVTIRPIKQINGASGFCEAFLEDVVVDDADRIGDLNQGWTVAQTMLVYERGAGRSAVMPTEPRAVAPDLVALANRVGRAHDPVARQLIARAHINPFAQYHLGRRLGAVIRSAAEPQPGLASYGKLASGTLMPIRARIGIEIGGPEALLWNEGDPDERRATAIGYLNGRMASIAAGTNEMMRNGISERVLGLPREPSFDSNKPFSDVVRDARNWDGRRS